MGLTGGENEARLDDAVRLSATFLARDVVDAPRATGGLGSDDDQEPVDDIADEVAEVAADHHREHALADADE